jgi:hypothetical protein
VGRKISSNAAQFWSSEFQNSATMYFFKVYLNQLGKEEHRETKRNRLGLCKAQVKPGKPASSLNLTLKLFFQVEMNKVSGGNKLTHSQANCHQ